MDYKKLPDGEYFVDAQPTEKQIPPASTWDQLSVNQLLDIQTQLQSRAWDFRDNPNISKVLQQQLGHLQQLINAQLNA